MLLPLRESDGVRKEVDGIDFSMQLRGLGWRSCHICHSATLSFSVRRIVDRVINGMGVAPASSDV